jgi:hypothetical protein
MGTKSGDGYLYVPAGIAALLFGGEAGRRFFTAGIIALRSSWSSKR